MISRAMHHSEQISESYISFIIYIKNSNSTCMEGRFIKLENLFSPNHCRILFCGSVHGSRLLRILGRKPKIRPFFIDFTNERLRRPSADYGATDKKKIFCESYGKTFVPACASRKTREEVERERFIFRKFPRIRGEIPFRSNRNNESRESAGLV